LRFTGLEYSNCLFDNCHLGSPPNPESRPYVGQSRFVGCRQLGSGVAGAVIDEVTVDGLGRLGRIPLFLEGVAFRHVVLTGRISFFKLLPAPGSSPTPLMLSRWTAANRSFYADVDWALDISKAEFTSGPDFHYVPGHLVRRNPETQALVWRDKLVKQPIPSLPWGNSSLRVALEWFLESEAYDSAVLAAGLKTKHLAEDLAAIAMLRERGLADAD